MFWRSFYNVFGTYYQYCIGFTKHYPGEMTGYCDAISLTNIHASKSERLPIQEAHMGNKNYHFPFIWIQGQTIVKRLSIDHLHRREYNNPVDTIRVDKDAVVDELLVYDLTVENHTNGKCEEIVNLGTIKKMERRG